MDQLKDDYAIVICARIESKRVPGKALRPIAGKPALARLIENIWSSGLRIRVVTPESDDQLFFDTLLSSLPVHIASKILVASNYTDCPMRRTLWAAKLLNVKNIVRITHDKIFVDGKQIIEAIKKYQSEQVDYLYSSHLPEGMGFEIFSTSILEKAVEKIPQNVEHISYAIRSMKPKMLDYKPSLTVKDSVSARFLLDYEEDFLFMEALFNRFDGVPPTPDNALAMVHQHPYLAELNRLPDVTVYTCVFNGEDVISRCIMSVLQQDNYNPVYIEYIVVDDCSKDHSLKEIVPYLNKVKLFRNNENIGLSSSSNIALKQARGRYIVRLDADDYFLWHYSLYWMLQYAIKTGADVVYPSYRRDKEVYSGSVHHHVGGALFKTSALEHFRFTEKLRGFEGLDLFSRAKDTLNVRYYEAPVFCYTETIGSLSSTKSDERDEIKRKLDAGITGEALVNG